MNRYTFVMDLDGGTYLSQVTAASPESALSAWAKQMKWAEVPGAEDTKVLDVLKELAEESLSPVDGLVKVWCFTISPVGKFAIIHVVES